MKKIKSKLLAIFKIIFAYEYFIITDDTTICCHYNNSKHSDLIKLFGDSTDKVINKEKK